jgi:hypothetical protein
MMMFAVWLLRSPERCPCRNNPWAVAYAPAPPAARAQRGYSDAGTQSQGPVPSRRRRAKKPAARTNVPASRPKELT